MRRRVKKLLRGTLPRFLILWVVMMGLLTGANLKSLDQQVEYAVSRARQNVAEDYREIRDGGADEVKKPIILAGRLSPASPGPKTSCWPARPWAASTISARNRPRAK